ncbi:type VI secretion system accessory protein TagJ [Roseibium sp.]|uniref:type VI secretion system accessory protein TagJ n=1 Tax=Roseibium sp. TaxID=1936156 RepID=UPI003A97CB5B
MDAENLLKQGDLDGALAALQQSIRKEPENPRLRVFLFQLLCIMGNWQRAVAQLKTCATLDPSCENMAQTYRSAILCEIFREKVFDGTKPPLVFGEPDGWIAGLIEALRLEARGERDACEALRQKSFEAAPAVSGVVNGQPFSWIADADPRLGPILEIIVNGRYFWAPFSSIRRLCMEAPADLRDYVWMPAEITWHNGGSTVALIPTRYDGSETSADGNVRLARHTNWITEGERVLKGQGQRLLATDAEDIALMNLRELTLGEAAIVAPVPEPAVSNDG